MLRFLSMAADTSINVGGVAKIVNAIRAIVIQGGKNVESDLVGTTAGHYKATHLQGSSPCHRQLTAE
jgi:hypothetical protein